jgi:tRNA 2-thiouridine synthesizing protein A
MHRLDCLGDMCPLPMMKLAQCRDQLDCGESVMVVTDHSCTCESILSYCQKQRLGATVEEPVSGVWEITIVRGDAVR